MHCFLSISTGLSSKSASAVLHSAKPDSSISAVEVQDSPRHNFVGRSAEVTPLIGTQQDARNRGRTRYPRSRILRHCNNPAPHFCLVCWRSISSCSLLKHRLENENQEVLGCGFAKISQRFCATSHTLKFYCVRRRTKYLRNGRNVRESY